MINIIVMESLRHEFKMEMVGERCLLYRVVDGIEHLIKGVKNYAEGADYIHGQYSEDWNRFNIFVDALRDAITVDLIDFEQGETIQVQKHIKVNGIVCKLWLIVRSEEWIEEVKVDHIDIHDDEMDELADYFVVELYNTVSEVLNCEMV